MENSPFTGRGDPVDAFCVSFSLSVEQSYSNRTIQRFVVKRKPLVL